MKMRTAQFGEEEPISFVKRIIQGMFVCHNDRTRTVSYITKSGIVRGKSWTRQILSDAWESTKWENLFNNPSHTVNAETKLTEKFIEDEKGTDLVLPRMLAEKPLEVECRKFYVWSANIQAHGHMGNCPVRHMRCLLCREKRQNHVRMNSDSESEGLLRELWQEKPGWKHTGTESLGESKSERGELKGREVQGICLRNPGIKMMSRWRLERFEQEAPNTSASSDPCVDLEYLVSGETQSRPGSVFVQKSGRVDDDVRISALDAILREGWTKESLHRRSVGLSRR